MLAYDAATVRALCWEILKKHITCNEHEREPLPYYLGYDSLLVVTEHRPGIEGLVARAP